MSATHHPDYVRAPYGCGVPVVWIAKSRDAACCDHHFSEGIPDITVNVMQSQRNLDEMRADCPYAQLEAFRLDHT